jgi:hypothetical protein
MVVVKILWDIVKYDDITLLILPYINTRYTNDIILQSFRECIEVIKCKYLVVFIPYEKQLEDILLYEDTFDKEFRVIKNINVLNDPEFLKHHDPSIAYLLQQTSTFPITFFTKIIINTLHCSENILHDIKSSKVPTHYGLCVFQEIITANIFIKEKPFLIYGKTSTECGFDNIDCYYCEEDGIVTHDMFNDLIDEMNGTPIFIGSFTIDDEKIKNRWNTFFSGKLCIYDLDAFESLQPTINYRLTKDVPNLLRLLTSKQTDLLMISSKPNH